MIVLVKRYADDSFLIEAVWHQELDDILADPNLPWSVEQRQDFDAAKHVWLNKNILIRKIS